MAKRKYRKYSNRWRKEFNMIKGFIEKRLRGKLISDQLECKILGESDLQSCVFSHLQKYFKDKSVHEVALLLSNTYNIAVRSGLHSVHSWFNLDKNQNSLFGMHHRPDTDRPPMRDPASK